MLSGAGSAGLDLGKDSMPRLQRRSAAPRPQQRRCWHNQTECIVRRELLSWMPVGAVDRDAPKGPSAPAGRAGDSSLRKSVKAFRRGKRLHVWGRPDEALDVVLARLAHAPHDPHLLSMGITLLAKDGQLERAAELLRTARACCPPGHPPLITAAAVVDAASGNYTAAAEHLQEGLAASPDNAVLLQALGEVEAAAGDVSKARACFQAATDAQPSMPHTYVAWARMEAAAGHPDAARAVYRRGADAAPGNAPLLHAWASMELDAGRVTAARTLLQQALAASPDHAPSYMLLGRLEWCEGNLAGARNVWRDGNARPGGPCPALLCYWAQHEMKSHNARGARHLLHAALCARPHHKRALALLAALEDRSGASDEAARAYNQLAHTASGESPDLDPGRGGTTQTARMPLPPTSSNSPGGSEVVAEASAVRSDPLPPDDSALRAAPLPALVAMCQHLLRAGRAQDAARVLAHVRGRAPNNGHACHVAGLLAQQEGQMGQAMASFQAGTSSSVRDGALLCWEGLAELWAFLGRPEEARATWRHGAAHAAASWPRASAWAGRAAASPHAAVSRHGSGNAARANGVTAPQHLDPSGPGMARSPTSADHHTPGDAAGSTCVGGPERPTRVLNQHEDGASLPEDRAAAQAAANGFPGLSSRYLRQWALFEKKTGDAAAAAVLFKASTVKDPRDVKTWLAWAMFERRRGDLGAAEGLFRRGLRVSPHNPLLWVAYANMVWRQKGDVQSARAVLRRATSACPWSVPLWLEWALLEWRGAGDPRAAAQLLRHGRAAPGGAEHGLLQQAYEQVLVELGGKPSLPATQQQPLASHSAVADNAAATASPQQSALPHSEAAGMRYLTRV